MGVPAFFRWLSRKYPSIVIHCVEDKGRIVDGVTIPADTSRPNPNDVEFDNLYLDMNGIIHPCCHPENKPAPKNEDEMMADIFEYIDRIFAIVRPRRLLYMAIDGVAPRAKMNQQRSRRFRASKESKEKRDEVARVKDEMRDRGMDVPPDRPAGEHFDSNCITPGTEFMFRLADCLRYYVHHRLNTDPGWRNVAVILSDANVPGEGEHKIMDFVRRQRAQPDHDPDTHHCLCGADADLIMLGLATHEPNFTIVREEFKPNQPRSCDVCGQVGHEMKDCAGTARENPGDAPPIVGAETEFIFIRLAVLREYLRHDLDMPNLPFPQDVERAIDDWVLMCFFVGNDFLPHLPSLEIREGAIDRLITLYKKAVYRTSGYLTDSGIVNLDRVQLVLTDLGEMEDEIFKRRRESDLDFRRRDVEKKKRQRRMESADAPRFVPGGQFAPAALGGGGRVQPLMNPRESIAELRQQARNFSDSNRDAASALRDTLRSTEQGQKRKRDDDEDEEAEPEDDVKLWEDGWKDRYYESKFAVDADDGDFRRRVASEYVLGICWVLKYYYQGCASWDWYFPYHYAPFASDFVDIGAVDTEFERDTAPFRPLEQLMSVFPAASKQFLPVTWQDLMDDPESPIIDFYPDDFRVDLNGKKYAWQGVALLPFVDEKRLLETLALVYPDLTEYEGKRNVRDSDRLFVGRFHPAHDFLEALYEGGNRSATRVELDPKLTWGARGLVWCDEKAVLTGETVVSPVPQLEGYHDNRAIGVCFEDPRYKRGYVFPARMLPGAKIPAPTLKPEDFDRRNSGGERYRPQLGFTRNSGYRGNTSAATANRLIQGSIGGGNRGGYNQMAPPNAAFQRTQFPGSSPLSWQQSMPQQRDNYGNRQAPNNYSGSSGGYGGMGVGYGNQSSRYGNQPSGYGNQSSAYNSQSSGYGNQYGGYGNQYGGYGNQSSGYRPPQADQRGSYGNSVMESYSTRGSPYSKPPNRRFQ